jgi:hypothetical protein
LIIPKFPEDFYLKPNDNSPAAQAAARHMQKIVEYSGCSSYHGKHWVLRREGDGKTIISVIGGGFGHYGDGVTTFEMYDFREEDPQGYLTVDEINEHLKQNPFGDDE